MTQSPLRPPTMNAAFKTPGQIATASALSSRSRGISFSGTDITLRRTSAASREWREASAARLPPAADLFFCADAGTHVRHAAANMASANRASRFDELICRSLLRAPSEDGGADSQVLKGGKLGRDSARRTPSAAIARQGGCDYSFFPELFVSGGAWPSGTRRRASCPPPRNTCDIS